MAHKVDCSKAVNFLREYSRMCRSSKSCKECGFWDVVEYKAPCVNKSGLFEKQPELAVAIVQKWSDQHPDGVQ